MINLLIGSNGVIGRQIAEYLNKKGVISVNLSAKQITSLKQENLKDFVDSKLTANLEDYKEEDFSLILTHRFREGTMKDIVINELLITRELPWMLSTKCSSLKVIVIGSVTGRQVSLNQPEHYHYAKDLQKSIVRQSIRKENISMNLIELSSLNKYKDEDGSKEYKENLKKQGELIGQKNLVCVQDIANYAYTLITMKNPPRGQILTYDGGYSLHQRD